MRKNYFNKEETINVAIYARVSTEHEAQINALQNQIQYYDNILKDHPNWILKERYIDKGITGTSILKRDSFIKMIKDANNGEIDIIITREVSRFARNTADTLVQVRQLVNNGVAVYFTEDNIFASIFSEDEWELKLSLMATLAQNESKKISSRVKAGQKISFENGVPYGNGNILGYDRVGKQMIINKEQAETVRRIFELYLSGHGLRKIQFILEQEGRKTASGLTKWQPQVISRTLKNSFYCGIIEYRKQYVPDYLVQKKINNKGDVEKIIVKGSHEPIITEEEFNQVQDKLKSKVREVNNRKVGHTISKDVYTRKLICECGHTFNRRISYVTKSGENRYLYQCYDQLRHGTIRTRENKGLDTEGACTSITVPNWKLELVADWIFRRFFDNKQLIFEKTLELINESLNAISSVQEIDDEIIIKEKELESTNEKYSSLIDLYVDGNIPKEMYLVKKENFENKIENIKNEIETLYNKKNVVQSENDLQERKKNISKFLEVKAFKKDKPIPSELIDYYVDSIKVDSEKMTWFLRIPNGTLSENVLNCMDVKKEQISTVTPHENHVSCAMQDRLLSTTHVNNLDAISSLLTLVNMGIYKISSNYLHEVKKYYFDADRVPRNEDFEIELKLIV